MIRYSPVLALCALLTGCATGEEARVAARVVLAETLQYERLVERKIQAEDTYYANRVRSLNESVDRALDNATRLNIANQGNRAAAELVQRNERITPADLVNFVTTVLRSQEEIFERISQRRQELRTLVIDAVGPLELDKAALQRARKSLEVLQVAPDEAVRLKDLYEFVKATRAEYDKLRKEDLKDAK